MNMTQDPRDVAILALRDALSEARRSTPPNADRIDLVLQETEQIASQAVQRLNSEDAGEYNLADLRGLGANLWRKELAGRDAQDYVSEMRDEWDERERSWRQ